MAEQAASVPEAGGRHRRRLFLASVSPRRAKLLADAGADFAVIEPGIDDADIAPGDVPPRALAMALAHLKARSGVARLGAGEIANAGLPIVLAADTIVVKDGAMLGKPASEAAAARTLASLCNGEHEVATGVALLALDGSGRVRRRLLRCDAARVRVGAISQADIEEYAESGQWRGKAGGYNYAERLAAGWPIACAGDVSTVMGLPMRLLAGWIDELAAHTEASGEEQA